MAYIAHVMTITTIRDKCWMIPSPLITRCRLRSSSRVLPNVNNVQVHYNRTWIHLPWGVCDNVDWKLREEVHKPCRQSSFLRWATNDGQ